MLTDGKFPLFSAKGGSDVHAAERDISGLCCPVELSGVLTASFKRTDLALLEWLQGVRAGVACSGGSAALYHALCQVSMSCLRRTSTGLMKYTLWHTVDIADGSPAWHGVLWRTGQEEEEKRAGATATVVLARRDKLVVANVGDSRAVLSRRWALLTALTLTPAPPLGYDSTSGADIRPRRTARRRA